MKAAEMRRRIEEERKQARTCGPIHRRDLMKHIRRMERELRDYDRFQQAAREAV